MCLAHTIGVLISGDKSKTLCKRIYGTAVCGSWTDINLVNDRIAMQIRYMEDNGIIRQDVHILLLLFTAVVTSKVESGIFMRFNTNC